MLIQLQCGSSKMAFDFHMELARGCRLMDIELDQEARQLLFVYFTELKKWSKKVNLIAKGTEDLQIVENHFLDSLALLSFLPKEAGLLDVGTGAGFPGLVCKAVRPDLQLFLVEPRSKRVSFLNHIVRILQLNGVGVFCSRVEDEEQLHHLATITHVTCRAVSDIKGFLEMTAALDTTGITRLCLKGPKWQQEMEEAHDILQKYGYEQQRVVEYVLPFSGAQRAIVALM